MILKYHFLEIYFTAKELKGKVYKKLTANDSKCNLVYLNKLVDEYNYTYLCSTDKKLVDADYSALTQETESIHKAPKFKVGNRVRINICH